MRDVQSDLQRLGKAVHIPAGTALFAEGDVCQTFLVVRSGRIKVSKLSDNGREVLLYRVDPDNLCVLTTSCLLAGSIYPAHGRTETDVDAVTLSKSEFDRLIVESKEFREMVFGSFSRRFSAFVEKIDEVVFHNLRERLWNMLETESKTGSVIAKTHQQLAQELGTEREVISRLLKQFERDGRLSLAKSEIKIIR